MKFSIAIPAYKRAFLYEAIESCLCQTYTDFELIIIDDASPEQLFEIVSQFTDQRINYFKNEKNCGAINVVDNWNKCLQYAKGNYIICMGDDDKLLPNCLEEYNKLINKYPNLGIYHAWTEIIDENGNISDITIARPEYESAYSLLWHRWKGRQQFIGDFCFEINKLRSNGGFYKLPLAWGSDDISAIIAAYPNGIANIQQIAFCYRNNSQTITNTGNDVIKLDAIAKEKEWYEFFLSKEPSIIIDKKIWTCIQSHKNKYFERKKIQTIARNVRISPFHIFFWILRRKKYELKFKDYLYILKNII